MICDDCARNCDARPPQEEQKLAPERIKVALRGESRQLRYWMRENGVAESKGLGGVDSADIQTRLSPQFDSADRAINGAGGVGGNSGAGLSRFLE